MIKWICIGLGIGLAWLIVGIGFWLGYCKIPKWFGTSQDDAGDSLK